MKNLQTGEVLFEEELLRIAMDIYMATPRRNTTTSNVPKRPPILPGGAAAGFLPEAKRIPVSQQIPVLERAEELYPLDQGLNSNDSDFEMVDIS